jgi:hypothetical protein
MSSEKPEDMELQGAPLPSSASLSCGVSFEVTGLAVLAMAYSAVLSMG